MTEMSNATPQYQPNRAKDGLDEHVVGNFYKLLLATALFWIGTYVVLEYLYPGRNDLERWLCEGYVHMVWGFTCWLWGLLFLQWVTNGNLFKRALQHATASALVIGCFLLAVVLLIIHG